MSEKKFSETLSGEIYLWEKEGIITHEQAERLSRRYRVEVRPKAGSEARPVSEPKSGQDRFIATLAILGSVLLGVGVILFFAANWQFFPRTGKLAIVILSLVAVDYSGYRLRYGGNFPKVGYGLLFLGMLLFGSAIFLIAQAYHIDAHFPNGFLLWGAGVIPAAYLINSRMGIGLAIIIMGVWMGLEASLSSMRPMYALGSLVMMYLAYGLFLFALGRAHRCGNPLSRLQGTYTIFGLFLVMAVTFVFSFKGASTAVSYYGDDLSWLKDKPLFFFYAFTALCLIASLYAYFRGGRGDRIEAAVIASLLLVAAFGVLQLNLPESRPVYQYGYGNRYSMKTPVYPIMNNILLLLEIVGALALGYRERKAGLINSALFFFVMLVGARYFDFLWELMPRSVFFMLGGLVLITGGIFLEKKRRKVISAIRSGAEA